MKKRGLAVGALLLLIVIAAGILLAQRLTERPEERPAAPLARTTQYPAAIHPDQVCLTWSADPRTTQAVQWRAAATVSDGIIEYRAKNVGERGTELEAGKSAEAVAGHLLLEDSLVVNDPVNSRFHAVLTDLTPNTTYTYRVGSANENAWSEWAEFTTAPEGAESFSCVYLGDAQMGFDAWGGLLRKAQETRPNAAFHIIAGDLVNRGNDRDDWDSFFSAARGIYDRYPLVPVLGNHECPKESEPRLYLQLFTLPENGPDTIPPERAYSLQYGNALFVVLDSNLPAQDQRPWLQQELAGSAATWKFAVFHHPAYSSKSNRDNPSLREHWCDLFDRYHVDMVFQGHDHAYLRTYPMREGQVVSSPAEGTIYVVAVSGSKFYEQADREYTAVGMVNTATFQIIDIESDSMDKLTYRAYDTDGNVRDELVIEKERTSGP